MMEGKRRGKSVNPGSKESRAFFKGARIKESARLKAKVTIADNAGRTGGKVSRLAEVEVLQHIWIRGQTRRQYAG